MYKYIPDLSDVYRHSERIALGQVLSHQVLSHRSQSRSQYDFAEVLIQCSHFEDLVTPDRFFKCSRCRNSPVGFGILQSLFGYCFYTGLQLLVRAMSKIKFASYALLGYQNMYCPIVHIDLFAVMKFLNLIYI